MHPTGTKMIKMERLGPISVHYGKKLAENYWKPEIKEAQKFWKNTFFLSLQSYISWYMDPTFTFLFNCCCMQIFLSTEPKSTLAPFPWSVILGTQSPFRIEMYQLSAPVIGNRSAYFTVWLSFMVDQLTFNLMFDEKYFNLLRI